MTDEPTPKPQLSIVDDIPVRDPSSTTPLSSEEYKKHLEFVKALDPSTLTVYEPDAIPHEPATLLDVLNKWRALADTDPEAAEELSKAIATTKHHHEFMHRVAYGWAWIRPFAACNTCLICPTQDAWRKQQLLAFVQSHLPDVVSL